MEVSTEQAHHIAANSKLTATYYYTPNKSPSSVSKSHVKKYFNDCQMPQNRFVDATFLGF
jgi:hypothetical protein